ncbi:hypothetical protein [Methyloglobulus sp.]|uniref:hypothetical protein n=1 Tax=Methyloglobulus sp. TaxID=2518622 RepID=UPI0039898D79
MEVRAKYQASNKNNSLRQGEILTDVIQYKPVADDLREDNQELSFEPIVHPFAIVVTQDCDLDWDFRDRKAKKSQSVKFLNSILLCEIATAREIRDNGENMNSGAWKLVVSHRDERFYFFEKISSACDFEQIGLPELTADFKRIFGIDAEILYRQIEVGMVKRRSILVSPYLEHFSRRYHSFHERIALPSQYESEREN